jgi:sulfite reductase alpha subunit-like flavoprotein
VWVFFVSTTGQGSLPFAVRTLWKEMMKKNYKIEQNIKFAIYSLGDRSYGDNFALAARKLRQRMKMLGAE